MCGLACLCMYYYIISFRFDCLFTPTTIHSVLGVRHAANDIDRFNDMHVERVLVLVRISFEVLDSGWVTGGSKGTNPQWINWKSKMRQTTSHAVYSYVRQISIRAGRNGRGEELARRQTGDWYNLLNSINHVLIRLKRFFFVARIRRHSHLRRVDSGFGAQKCRLAI